MGDNVFINGRAAVHKGSNGKARSFPDVCLCPPSPPAGPVPTPLTNIVEAKDLAGGARTVLIEGNPVGKMSSFFAKSTGNEASRPTGGGVVSHAVQGKAYFATYSSNVFIEGEPAVRHLDLLTQNHLEKGLSNTPPSVWLSVADAPAPGNAPKNRTIAAMDGKDWIEFVVVDETEDAVAGGAFILKTPGGKTLDGHLLSGGRLRVTKIASGQCRVSLPDVDDAARDAKRRNTTFPTPGTVHYKPGRPLQLDTGKTHTIGVSGTKVLWVALPRRGRKGFEREGHFTLRNTDGTYSLTLSAADHRSREGGKAVLAFPGLFKGSAYTLTQELGSGRPERALFFDRDFDDLFPPQRPNPPVLEPRLQEIQSSADDTDLPIEIEDTEDHAIERIEPMEQ